LVSKKSSVQIRGKLWKFIKVVTITIALSEWRELSR